MNMQALMKQAQAMQKDITNIKNESCNIRIWFRGIYNRLVLLEVLELLEILELLKVIKVLKVIEVLKMPQKL